MSENPSSSDPTQHLPQAQPYQDSPPPAQPYQGYSHQGSPSQASYPMAPQYGTPPPYAPQYTAPYGQVGRDHPQGTLAFVLGLLSILGITILGPFGWYYGRKVVREIDASPGTYTNRGFGMAGMVLGIIGTVLLIIIVLLILLVIVFAVVGAGTTSGG